MGATLLLRVFQTQATPMHAPLLRSRIARIQCGLRRPFSVYQRRALNAEPPMDAAARVKPVRVRADNTAQEAGVLLIGVTRIVPRTVVPSVMGVEEPAAAQLVWIVTRRGRRVSPDVFRIAVVKRAAITDVAVHVATVEPVPTATGNRSAFKMRRAFRSVMVGRAATTDVAAPVAPAQGRRHVTWRDSASAEQIPEPA